MSFRLAIPRRVLSSGARLRFTSRVGLCAKVVLHVEIFSSNGRKTSTRSENEERIRFHLVSIYKGVELTIFPWDSFQDLLDEKSKSLSSSVCDHLKWDLVSIFLMAVAEGKIERNPTELLFTPKEAKRPVRRAMSIDDVRKCFAVLGQR